jgi:hypothetical protein
MYLNIFHDPAELPINHYSHENLNWGQAYSYIRTVLPKVFRISEQKSDSNNLQEKRENKCPHDKEHTTHFKEKKPNHDVTVNQERRNTKN